MIVRQCLNGAWNVRDAEGDYSFQGLVPGVIQYDLLRLGLLPDPYYRLNEGLYYGIPEKDWEYSLDFTADPAVQTAARTELVLEGVDTCGRVFLNGHLLTDVDNMFIPHIVDISSYIRTGENHLRVELDSVIRVPRERSEADPVENRATVDPNRNYLRKAQYSYGWDWGPRLATMGLFRGVYIRYIPDARLQDIYFEPLSLDGQDAWVRIRGRIDFPDGSVLEGYTLAFTLSLNGEVAAQAILPGTEAFSTRVKIESAALWYPAGYGEQPLYHLTVQLRKHGETVDQQETDCGVRFIRLLREKDDRGESFVFSVNGVQVFARGANWIPGDNFLPRMDDGHYEKEVGIARDAGMNMLRVWGGGIYENDCFYSLCDRFGIMVWQDFMFSCAEYPDHLEDFRAQCCREAETVVRLLRNHPCIVLWCGNNENNLCFVDAWGHGKNPAFFGNHLYTIDLPRIVKANAPDVPYWVSSPYSIGSGHPNGQEAGDRHTWSVWSEDKPISSYLSDQGRFISEFGFQAMPCYRTVLEYTAPEDRFPGSAVITGHNKHNGGMLRLQRYMVEELGLPRDFKSFVYLSQYLQAYAIRLGVEHWRKQKFSTAGTLYWQLNDCWPVASWSCVDYAHRKKALFYATRRFYAPCCTVMEILSERRLGITLINDTLSPQEAELTVRAYRLSGELIGSQTRHILATANKSAACPPISLEELGVSARQELTPVDGFCSVFSMPADVILQDVIFFCSTKTTAGESETELFVPKLRSIRFPKPSFTLRQDGNRISLRSDKPALSVFLEPENDVSADDNCLAVRPGREYVVTFDGDPGKVTAFSFADLVIN